MTRRPTAQSPTMQMYLFQDSGSADALDFRNINGGDDSGVVWHEYTHGLSNRLVTNADGSGALSTPALRARWARRWSDWYASDLQVRDGLKADDLGTPGEIDVGDYSDLDPHALRSQAARLPGRRRRRALPRRRRHRRSAATRSATSARSRGAPEVHADGEIWCGDAVGPAPGAAGQDRQRRSRPPTSPRPSSPTACGSRRPSRRCSTCATRSWPPSRPPSAARSTTSCGTCSASAAWATSPPRPTAPTHGRSRTSRRRRTRTARRAPSRASSPTPTPACRSRASASASAATRRSPTFADYLADETDASGRYTIDDVPAGSYPKLAFFPTAGYDPERRRATSRSPRTRRPRATCGMTRDWASLGRRRGGRYGQRRHRRPDRLRSSRKAFDQSQGTTWSAFNPTSTDPENPQAARRRSWSSCRRRSTSPAFLIDPSRRLRRRRLGDDARVHGRDLGGRDDVPDRRRRHRRQRVHRRQHRPAQPARAGRHDRRGRQVRPGHAAQPAARGRRLRAAGVLRHGLHRPDRARGPRRPSEPAADGLARRQQRQPADRSGRHVRRRVVHRHRLGDQRLRLGLRRQRHGRPHAPARRRRTFAYGDARARSPRRSRRRTSAAARARPARR